MFGIPHLGIHFVFDRDAHDREPKARHHREQNEQRPVVGRGATRLDSRIEDAHIGQGADQAELRFLVFGINVGELVFGEFPLALETCSFQRDTRGLTKLPQGRIGARLGNGDDLGERRREQSGKRRDLLMLQG